MKDTIKKHYPNLTGRERFQLALKAAAAGNDEEREWLVRSCPKKEYRMNEAAFVERIEAAENLTLAFALDYAQIHGRLQLMTVFEDYVLHIMDEITLQAFLSLDICYEEGVKEGWQTAGRKETHPCIDKQIPENLMNKMFPKNERYSHTLAMIRTALQGQVKTLWVAFSKVCRDDMGLEPDIPLATFYPLALEWLETDLTDDTVVNKDMKEKSLEQMRDYWQKSIGE